MNSKLTVNINQVKVNIIIQPLMRILNYLEKNINIIYKLFETEIKLIG